MRACQQTSAERSCPVCGESSNLAPFASERIDAGRIGSFTYASRKEPEFMRLRLVRCRICDLVFAPVLPSDETLRAGYAEASFDTAIEAQAAALSYRDALEPFLDELRGIRSVMSAVDVGAGSGALLPLLREKGFKTVVGIEPSRAAVAAAKDDVRPFLREGFFSSEIISDLNPDLLCSFMTLEHISDPGVFVAAAYEVLRPGGMIALATHDWRAFVNRILGMKSPIIDIEHLQLFSEKSLARLLQKGGFERIRLFPIVNRYPLRYWIRLMPIPLSLKETLQRNLLRAGWSECPVALRVGNVMAIAFKPHSTCG